MIVTKDYKTHSYQFHYRLADSPLFCPECGTKGVWQQEGEGDYYVGPEHVCTACSVSFTYQGASSADEQILRQLVTGHTERPEFPIK